MIVIWFPCCWIHIRSSSLSPYQCCQRLVRDPEIALWSPRKTPNFTAATAIENGWGPQCWGSPWWFWVGSPRPDCTVDIVAILLKVGIVAVLKWDSTWTSYSPTLLSAICTPIGHNIHSILNQDKIVAANQKHKTSKQKDRRDSNHPATREFDLSLGFYCVIMVEVHRYWLSHSPKFSQRTPGLCIVNDPLHAIVLSSASMIIWKVPGMGVLYVLQYGWFIIENLTKMDENGWFIIENPTKMDDLGELPSRTKGHWKARGQSQIHRDPDHGAHNSPAGQTALKSGHLQHMDEMYTHNIYI